MFRRHSIGALREMRSRSPDWSLALAVLSPASALANAGGTDRPIKGAGTGTISLDPATGAFTGVVPGVSSHLGDITVHIEGVGARAADGTFAGSGTATLVAANGDEVTGTITLTQDGAPRRSHGHHGGRDDHRRDRTVRERERNADGDLPVRPPVPSRGDAAHQGGVQVHGTDQLLASPWMSKQRPRRLGPLRCPRCQERVAWPHDSPATSLDPRPDGSALMPAAADPALRVFDWPVPAGRPRIGSVLLVHGFGEHLGRYAEVAPTLNDLGLHVRGYDARGHGRSPGPRGVIRDPPALLEDLVRMFGLLSLDATKAGDAGSTVRARAQPGRHARRASRDLRHDRAQRTDPLRAAFCHEPAAVPPARCRGRPSSVP